MTAKQKILDLLNKQPDTISWDELTYKIYVLQSIEEGLQQIDENKLISINEVKEKYNF